MKADPSAHSEIRRPTVLTIAGSDSGGGAGIQADLKTFQELGVYGMSVITAVTAQNSLGVHRMDLLSSSMVEAQLESVLSDMGADAVKTGMLPTAAIVERIAKSLQRHKCKHLVVDPVSIAKDGTALMGHEAFAAMKRLLLPMAEIVTPNLPEACMLLEVPVDSVRTMEHMKITAQSLLELGPRHVFLKGGHLEGMEAVDVLVSADQPEDVRCLRVPRNVTPHTHGTGCTTASAIAAGLARGLTVYESCLIAKTFITAAIAAASPLGRGTGSLWHGAYRDNRSFNEMNLLADFT
jgi:hydroxymethylpyrimidine/phosphomethylpyrimidine kinase